jgi:hypothetical protein
MVYRCMANLRGTPGVKVILDRASVKRAQSDFAAALHQTLPKAVEDLVRRGAQHLHDLEQGLGHDTLADLWTYTPVTVKLNGTAEATVFSRAEDMRFHKDTTSATGERVRSNKPSHVVDGDLLMTFLERGTRPHSISATSEATGGALFFPISTGFKQSDMGGVASTPDGDLAALLFSGPAADSFFEGQTVSHPGFEGNHNVEITFRMMEAGVAQFMSEAGARIVRAFEGRGSV